METFFIHHAEEFRLVGYLILFIGMLLEGEVILFAAFFLSAHHGLNPAAVLAVAFLGVIIGDIGWYKIGSSVSRFSSLGKRSWMSSAASGLDCQLRKRLFTTILVAKFTYGLCHIILMRTGAIGINFYHYLKINLLVNVFWIFVIAALGYASAMLAVSFNSYFSFLEIGILVLVALGFLHWLIFKKRIQERLFC